MGCGSSQETVSTNDDKVPLRPNHLEHVEAEQASPPNPESVLWGIPLELAAKKSDPQQLIPLPIKKSIMYINDHALDDEGIYRVSAGVAKLKKIRQEFDSGRGNQFEYPPFSGYEAAGIVINYIGSLPESLFTNELIKKFNEAAEREDKEMMKKLLLQLPKTNLETVRFICEHLAVVAQHSAHNKMNIPNLARCFGPDYNKVLTFLIVSGSELFPPKETAPMLK
jgi:hypothetical protein